MSLPFNSSSSMDSLFTKNNTDTTNPANNLVSYNNNNNNSNTYGVSNYNSSSYQNLLDL